MLIRKRNDESSLKLGALLAEKAGALELASMLANQSLQQSLLVEKWDIASEVVLQHARLKVKMLKLQPVCMHCSSVHFLCKQQKGSHTICP